MSAAPEAFLVRLAEAAAAAEREERDYRESYYKRLAALERARVFAHRRVDLLGKIFRALMALEEPKEARVRVVALLQEEVGLLPGNEGHRVVIDRFHDVTDAILALRAPDAGFDESEAFEALRDFEDWYRARGGGEFFALFDVYFPETPRVDF